MTTSSLRTGGTIARRTVRRRGTARGAAEPPRFVGMFASGRSDLSVRVKDIVRRGEPVDPPR